MAKRNRNSNFGTGGVYTCSVCGKRTRETGDSESHVDLCAECFAMAGDENSVSDGLMSVKEFIDRYGLDAAKKSWAISDKQIAKATAKHKALPHGLNDFGEQEFMAFAGAEEFENGQSPVVGEVKVWVEGGPHGRRMLKTHLFIGDKNGIELHTDHDGDPCWWKPVLHRAWTRDEIAQVFSVFSLLGKQGQLYESGLKTVFGFELIPSC